MLKITAFAKLAGTTRRTLLFYDREGLFKPAVVESNGYRYYTEDQLYQFELIGSLRQLGFSIEEIKQVLKEGDEDALERHLLDYRAKLRQEIKRLQALDLLLNQHAGDSCDMLSDLLLGTVTISTQGSCEYWCTNREADCTPEDIASLHAGFMRELGGFATIAPGRSGFVTDLELGDPEDYNWATFRIIRECGVCRAKNLVARIRQESGRYLSIKVKNTHKDIVEGLTTLKDYALENGLRLSGSLWQINADRHFVKNAASEEGILQYLIIE